MKGWFLYNYGIMLDKATQKIESYADYIWNSSTMYEYCKKKGLLQEYNQGTPPPHAELTQIQQEAIVLQSMLQICEQYEYYEICETIKQKMDRL